jgi:hypothetical protein
MNTKQDSAGAIPRSKAFVKINDQNKTATMQYITPTTQWFSSHRTGGLEGLNVDDITAILNFPPLHDDDPDKVVNTWRCFVDGSPFAIWDYKGSHHAKRWSIYDPEHKVTDIFPLKNISKF